jgi:glycyl-tRNA synthetase beta chain
VSRDLVFEIGTEELPSGHIYTAIEQLQVLAPKAFDDARLGYDDLRVMASPRRLVVLVSELSEMQADAVHTHKGPAAKAAFDGDGKPTPAAIGFARGKGVPVESLAVVDDENGSYVYATVEVNGLPTLEVLPGILERLAGGIEWPKSQRWGTGDVRFSRPVRWLLALFGTEVVPVEFAGLTATGATRGHRFLAPGQLPVKNAYEYLATLEDAKVAVDHEDRAARLRIGIETVARQLDAKAVVAEKTFSEVVNLVEWPTVAVGEFDSEFLQVPREILVNAMESHQRYFPVEDASGVLMNRFVVAHNGDPERTEQIVRGHERVIRARLSDAAFFYREDLALPLEEYVGRLETIVFQDKLGSLGDKVRRVERLAERIAQLVDAPADVSAWATRAAHLAKADLVTAAVVEFTDLQGVMGGYYAQSSGEAPEVAQAIVEHYRPRYSGDEPPSTDAGRIVAIADKMDTIAGIFSAGMAPTGSADPFALRRAAIGVLQMLVGGMNATVTSLISEALEGYEGVVALDADAVGSEIAAFLRGRFEGLLRDRGHAYDTVDAVLAVAADDAADALARCEALTAFRAASDDMEDLSVAFTRARNLAKPELGVATDRSIMGEHEATLANALDSAEKACADLLYQRAYSALLESYAGLRAPIDAFFDNVMVMDEDPALRDNRLRLLNRFVALFERFADFTKLAG